MKSKKLLYLALIPPILVLAVVIILHPTEVAGALSLIQSDEPTDVTIPFPGNLADESGKPVADGAYDFTFSLFDVEIGGKAFWEETQEGVSVQGGAFNVLLGSVIPLPREVNDGGVQWLEIAVRGFEEAGFTTLFPRQELSASISPESPSAGASCAHDHIGEVWSGSVGWSNAALRVNNSGNGPSIWGWNTGGGNGIRGDGWGSGIGVYGEGESGPGVAGRSGTGFGISANGGGDSTGTDLIGDLELGGDRGEIFSFGSSYMNLYTNTDFYVDLDNDNNNANACYQIINGSDTAVSQVCEDGSKSAVLQTEDYGQRAMYTIESPEIWLEDFGTASLVNGLATVALEPIFAETVNTKLPYHVFVTPVCQQPVLLFVTSKGADSFVVQGVTLDGKSSTCSFDYRITAKRLGLENLRLRPVLPGK